MQKIFKLVMIEVIFFQVHLFAIDLPDRGGKYGDFFTGSTTKKIIQNNKSISSSCTPLMVNKIKLHVSGVGRIYIRNKVYGYTTITKCGQPYNAEVLYTELYLRYRKSYGNYFRKICAKGASNKSFYRVVCSKNEWFGDTPNGKAGSFAARVDSDELSAELGKN